MFELKILCKHHSPSNLILKTHLFLQKKTCFLTFDCQTKKIQGVAEFSLNFVASLNHFIDYLSMFIPFSPDETKDPLNKKTSSYLFRSRYLCFSSLSLHFVFNTIYFFGIFRFENSETERIEMLSMDKILILLRRNDGWHR